METRDREVAPAALPSSLPVWPPTRGALAHTTVVAGHHSRTHLWSAREATTARWPPASLSPSPRSRRRGERGTGQGRASAACAVRLQRGGGHGRMSVGEAAQIFLLGRR